MALQVFSVKVCLVAMRAGELSIRVLGRNRRVFGGAIDTIGDRSHAARNARKNTTSALRSNHLSAWRFLCTVSSGTVCSCHRIGVHPRRGLAVGVAESARWHTIEVGAAIPWWSGRNWLWVSLRARSRW